MTLGKRIARARNRLRLRQEDVGALFGISKQAVSAWERDVEIPTGDKILPLARLLKVPVLWLLDGGDDPPPSPDDIESRLEALPPTERAALNAVIDTILKRYSAIA